MAIAALADAPMQAFIMTANRARAIGFYRDVLGLSLQGEDAFSAIFALGGGHELRLVDQPDWQAHPHTVVGWKVADCAAAVAELAAHGVAPEIYEGMGQDAAGIWHSPHASLAWFRDPDGNVLSIVQHHI